MIRWVRHALRSLIRTAKVSSDYAGVLWGFGGRTAAGPTVNADTAVSISAVYNAVNLIGNAVAVAPIMVYERSADGEGKERRTQHPAYRVLQKRPNPQMTANVFRRLMQQWCLLWGNGIAEIERDGAGRPLHLWPIHPSRVEIGRDARGDVYYRVHQADYMADARPSGRPEEVWLPQADVFHVMNYTTNGLVGKSTVALAAEAMGIALGAERYAAKFFSNNAQPSLVLTHPTNKLSPEARKRIREDWMRIYGGENVGGPAVLEEGMKVEKLGMPNDEAQFLETRVFQISEIARWFNVPPHKLKELSKATYSNIEHQALETVGDCYLPWFVHWEQEASAKLLQSIEHDTYLIEFIVEGLLRGDLKSRYDAYAVGRQWGWLNADEIRQRENMNPMPDGTGKIYLFPVNMQPADALIDVSDDAENEGEPRSSVLPPISGRMSLVPEQWAVRCGDVLVSLGPTREYELAERLIQGGGTVATDQLVKEMELQPSSLRFVVSRLRDRLRRAGCADYASRIVGMRGYYVLRQPVKEAVFEHGS